MKNFWIPIWDPRYKVFLWRRMAEHCWLFWDTCQSQGTRIPHSWMLGTELATPTYESCTLTHSVLCTKTASCHKQIEALWRDLLQGVCHEFHTVQQCTDWHWLPSCRFQQVVHTWWDLTYFLLPEKLLWSWAKSQHTLCAVARFCCSLLAAITHTVLTMLFGNHFAAILDCFLKASTSSNLAPLLSNRW